MKATLGTKIRNYKDIPLAPFSKEQIEDIILNASPKQKAIVNALGYTDRRLFGMVQAISTEDYYRIVDSIPENSKDFKEYMKWVRAYVVIYKVYNLFDGLYNGVFSYIHAVETYLYSLDGVEEEENHLNQIYEDMSRSGNEEGIKTLEETLSKLPFRFSALTRTDEQTYRIRPDHAIICTYRDAINRLDANIGLLKALIVAIEKWLRRKGIKAISPRLLLEKIERVKEYSYTPILARYREKEITGLLDRGLYVWKNRRIAGIIQDYEDIPLEESFVTGWDERIKEIENEAKETYR